MAPSVDLARFELTTFTEFPDFGNVYMKATMLRKNDLFIFLYKCIYTFELIFINPLIVKSQIL